MTREQIINRAIKLIRLAENNSNANEAASAAAAAQALLDRHGIERAMLDQSEDDPTDQEPVGKQGVLQKGAVVAWRQRLAGVLAKANGCQVYIMKMRGGGARCTEILLVGRESDAQSIRYLFEAITREMNRLVRLNATGQGRVYSNNYRHGVVDAISTKLVEQKAETIRKVRTEHTGTALVRVDNAIAKWQQRANDSKSWMNDNLNLGSGSRSSMYGDRTGRAAGQRDGASINVGRARGALAASPKRIRNDR